MSQDLSNFPKAVAVRQTWIDQTRWCAIVLVVVGHAVGLLRSTSDLAVVVSNFVYMFHIPVLVLLAVFYCIAMMSLFYVLPRVPSTSSSSSSTRAETARARSSSDVTKRVW